mmetsp:Transcript_22398/g.33532  ORF Transcript_22398/g.33532 Transcript_22398/m.33532 type:complete len:101 (-) Transcript_22398:400-702(-)
MPSIGVDSNGGDGIGGDVEVVVVGKLGGARAGGTGFKKVACDWDGKTSGNPSMNASGPSKSEKGTKSLKRLKSTAHNSPVSPRRAQGAKSLSQTKSLGNK